MATTIKKYLGDLWPRKTERPKGDPAIEQLRRDRITALILVAVLALVFAAIAIMSAFNGGTVAPDTFDPWIMP